jgi:uncharacterized repeat protein (TIGR02543 family)
VQYTVTFDLDGGNIAGDTTAQTFSVSYNSTVANMPANPTQTGHAFGGWYTAQNGAGGEFTASTQVTADTTVYAKWTAQWTVTFDLDGGNINGVTTTPTWTVNSGDSVGAENTPMPSRSGYAFGGWYTAQDGAGDLFTASTPVTADTTVYAKWSKSESIQIVLRPTSDDPQLSNASLFVDDSANFDAGSDYASWKWYWDGTAISGATSSTYTMAANSRTSGTYELSVVVTTNTGEKRSARCRVVIKAH